MDERDLHLGGPRLSRGTVGPRCTDSAHDSPRAFRARPARGEGRRKDGNRRHVPAARPASLQPCEPPASTRPARRVLSDVQRSIVEAVDREGYTTLRFDELVTDDALRDAVLGQGASFVEETERGLREESTGTVGLGASPPSRQGVPRQGSQLRRRPARARPRVAAGVRCRRTCSPSRTGVPAHVGEAVVRRPLVHRAAAAEAERVASQLWHYDFDDRHLLKAFLYLDDVDAETGPFEYVAGSQPGGPHHAVRPWRPMGYGRVPEEVVQRSVPDEAIARSLRRAERSSSATRAAFIVVDSRPRGHACLQPRRIARRHRLPLCPSGTTT